MVVAVDPETGQLGMPEREAAALTIDELQEMARREAQGLVTIHHSDGSETINHQGRFADYAIVRMGSDGRLLFDCVSGTPGLRGALRPGQPARSGQEEE